MLQTIAAEVDGKARVMRDRLRRQEEAAERLAAALKPSGGKLGK
jgi:hypothetical protein